MSVLRTHVDFAKRIFADRVGNDYVYGGNWSPTDTSIGTDCSGLVIDILDACVNGTRMAWSRHGMSTESWRPIEVGETGPFGTITVADPSHFPPDAVVKVALHHGPGGGANSHMWCECDGVRMESNGSDGAVTGNQAMSVYDTSYANDWAYLPGPIISSSGPTPLSKPDQYALAIIDEGRRRGITERGIEIALATALVESNMRMYANSSVPESLNLPHDAVGSDHDSLGLFQQRCPMWGPANVLMDPTQSAGLFYDHLAQLDYNDTTETPGYWAQAVQRSAFPDRYDQRFADAVALYERLATTGGGIFMALSDAEQRELLDLARQQSGYRRVSRSPLRHVGEGPTETATGFELNVDGSVHVLLVNLLARLGDPDALALLNEVANLNPAVYPDRVHDKQLARAVLNDIAGQATADTAPSSGQTPGTIPTPVSVPPAPIAVPPPPVQVPPPPPTVPPTGGGISSGVNAVDTDLATLRAVLADLTQQIRS